MFTVGHTKSYEKYIDSDANPVKLGANSEYGGGIAFHSVLEAESWLSRMGHRDYSVYRLHTDSDNCYFDRMLGELRILETATISRIQAEGETT